MLGCYLDPKNDYAFRKIFGDQKREHVLRHFLNSVLELSGDKKIKRLRIADPHQVPKLKEHKETILDVYCKDQSGREFIVEMQVSDQKDFEHRAVYYLAKSFVSQLKKGDDFIQLRKVTLLSILDFPFLENPHYLSTHLLLDKKTGEHKLKDFEFAFLELVKFNKKEEELKTIEDKWAYFFKHAHKTPLRDIPAALHEPDFEEVFGVLEEIGRSELETKLYEKADMDRMDRRSQIDTGYKKGLEEGHKKGLSEGEKRKALQIARHLLSMGTMDKAAIMQATGLAAEDIETLQRTDST
ncbi:MAG: Rpn family recombination-promoting nuclease/putative transposase [Myxococcota bacterium]